MSIQFSKFHGTGNDFIIIDNRDASLQLSQSQIKMFCARHVGVGADGLILAELAKSGELFMRYYNSDGHEASMCGNGGRCFAAWAVKMEIVKNEFEFLAADGKHSAIIDQQSYDISNIILGMADVHEFKHLPDGYLIDTGSPHFVKLVKDPDEIDVVGEGRRLRNDKRFLPGGVNVNFAVMDDNQIKVRTYERGVEDETLSCGTGVTAVAIAAMIETDSMRNKLSVITRGGTLRVNAVFNGSFFEKVELQGQAQFVFKGEIH